jgi:ATP-dependent helicase/nuclease subunit B
MLKIYAARENADKEKFIYEHISGPAFVIVPNQYTLEAEKQALKYMGRDCLFDVEIISMNRLGLRLLREKGLENVPTLDKYGRFMLLSQIIDDMKDELDVFEAAADKRSFISMVNDFISDFKQQDCSADDIGELLEGSSDEVLGKKLSELSKIMDRYEKAIEGRYTDSEDRIAMYVDAIADSRILDGHEIWVYGFDSVTPKFMDALTEMALRCEVSFIENDSDQGLGRMMAGRLERAAREKGAASERSVIGPEYTLSKDPVISYLEENAFTPGGPAESAMPSAEEAEKSVTLVECANPFFEAESAAVYVHSLLRDEGYRMSDIVVICNDEDSRQPVIKRTFEEYGIPLFVDSRRGISDSAAAGFIVSQLDAVLNGYRTPSIIVMMKTGLTGIPQDRIDRLESYVKNYSIKGSMWLRPLKYGSFEYSDSEFAMLEETRQAVIGPLQRLEKLVGDSETVREFTERFYDFLCEVWDIKTRLEHRAQDEEEAGLAEEAERTAQTFEACMHIMDQVVEILGDSPMDLQVFLDMYREGLGTVDVGVIPPALDGIAMGTMIRTRPADVKAVLILGANEGILPLEPSPEGLFSVEEKDYFSEKGFPLGGLDDIKMLEENAAMYRMVSKPSSRLYISWSLADTAGEDCRPSTLVDSVTAALPDLRIRKDVVSSGFDIRLVNDERETLRHLMNHLKERPAQAPQPSQDPAALPEDILAHALMSWYEEHEPDVLKAVLAAARDTNRAEPIPRDLAKRLFAGHDGDYRFSASRLEKYGRCPFEHFVSYGLRPKEEREFRSSGREIGDMYHECIMRVSRRLERSGSWAVADEDMIRKMVGEEIGEIASGYRGGLFISGGREEYRLERIRRVCIEALTALAEQMRSGRVEMSFFEEKFGRGCRFGPLECDSGGEKVYIEGKMDRVDIMPGGRVRVIDYKTGRNDKIDVDQMRCGYRLQLMVYMAGAENGEYEPAGVFYFKINDDDISAANMRSFTKQQESRFKLNGAYVNDPEIMDDMPEDIVDPSSSRGMPREEFRQLEDDVRKSVEKISDGIVSGDISIEPTMEANKNNTRECHRCSFRSICRFDLTYRSNRFRII